MTSHIITQSDTDKTGLALRIVHKIGFGNWRGFLTLLWKEIHRFLKVPLQTILAPMMTTVLFLAIFSLAFGGSGRYVGSVSYENFLAPGLIMMAVIQNAFANTSSSILISKIQGNIVDILMPPLSATELTLAFVLSGVARGISVALVVGIAIWPFVDITVHSWPVIIYYIVGSGLMLSLLGIIAGIISEKFDHMAAVTNFIIMPLSFLSGTFYSIERLTGIWYQISHLNPFFYMIDGFRYGFIGTSDSAVWVGATLIAGIDILLYIFVWVLIKSGYRLKA
ncbi:MAG: multidrug ABC transporter permease [Sneathiella sp.]|jgi:ABC-2 type transport system permease protein|uniref:ABC transporter permease n=1 Tax=Sneathiella sp. TaxID=1964365 RepID=UPI000C4AECBE|nr:ABC transporter permease [Sneathiella sp.]MAL79439.1 multidrug ABC transporter permease [Sneathiella sp.]|tara:strand:- start:650 stop:1489 length:840 start_codon:yes stop_codon:yes gene_type:complete